jgi:DNA-binding CsgD family transcriptional regulator
MFVSRTRDKVAELLTEGLTPSEIARRLRLARPTVSYHVERIRRGIEDGRRRQPRVVELDESARRRPTRELVFGLLAEGLTRAEIARTLGVTKGTVSYHAGRLGAEIDERCARRYDWPAVQRYHDAGHGMRECLARFGLSGGAWYEARRRGDLITRSELTPIEELLVAGRARDRGHIKRRILTLGLKEPRCERCGITEWRGEPLSMALHHVNGDRQDNRLENLQFLCPNCHSQTENFAGRNGQASEGANGRLE